MSVAVLVGWFGRIWAVVNRFSSFSFFLKSNYVLIIFKTSFFIFYKDSDGSGVHSTIGPRQCFLFIRWAVSTLLWVYEL